MTTAKEKLNQEVTKFVDTLNLENVTIRNIIILWEEYKQKHMSQKKEDESNQRGYK